MISEDPRVSTLNLLARIDERLSLTIREALHASGSSVPPRALGVEIFLCALYRHYPREILKYYDDSSAFKRLEDALWPNRVSSRPEWAVKMFKEMDAPPNTAVGWHLKVESNLERILLNASRISIALGHINTSIPDLVASLATEEQVSQSLKQDWGIVMKARPEGSTS